jgi:RNA polymerase sigma factor (sigma-70 family)
VDEQTWLAQRFEEHRAHLHGVAYRLLGSPVEAQDAVQETWIRLSRVDHAGVENLRAWLTTVVGRVCLDMLRTRVSRREDPIGVRAHAVAPTDPEQLAVLADSVGLAMLVLLDALNPAERLAFVLHDTFEVPFEQIASVLGRSPAATRQLASRARRRLRAAASAPRVDLERQHVLVAAFLAAARAGDFDALLRVLDPNALVRADTMASPDGVPTVLRGARAVAEQAASFARRARYARAGLVNGAVGLLVGPHRTPDVVLTFAFRQTAITGIDVIADPPRISRLRMHPCDDAAYE